MKTILSILLLVMNGAFAQAQNQTTLPTWQVNVSYFGEFLTHPGIRLGVDHPLTSKVKEKRNGNEVIKGWTTGGALTYYRHTWNHTGLLLTGRIGRQRIGAQGLLTEYHGELGYMASWLDGEVYEPSGNTFEEANAGSSHVVLGFNGGVGWSFDRSLEVPLAVTIKPHLWFQIPFNTWVLPHVAAEINVKYFIR